MSASLNRAIKRRNKTALELSSLLNKTVGYTPPVNPALGNVWGDLTDSILNKGISVLESREVNKQEQAILQSKLKLLQEQNRAIEQQRQLEITQHEINKGNTFSAALLEHVKSKPWAIPAVGGLAYLLLKRMKVIK